MMSKNRSVLFVAAFLAASAAVAARADVNMAFVTVGNPGNAADQNYYGQGSYGSVAYTYQMGKYDVTVGQYCQFLNAVAKTDTYGLYNNYMAVGGDYGFYPTIGITQSGSSGSYSYSVTGSDPQAANCPVADVTWGDAARFCNWLQNNQPHRAEGPGTTETGAYTLNGATTNAALMAITRNAGAVDFIPSENEWYKAAYYNPSNGSYWLYPTQSNNAPSNVLSATGTNNANDDLFATGTYNVNYFGILTDPTNYLTPVGAFAASPGPYGTYDMGGDVDQWNEAKISGTVRGKRGGNWIAPSDYLAASLRDSGDPTNELYDVGFRVASAVPEPGSLMMLLGFAGMALLYYWRRHA